MYFFVLDSTSPIPIKKTDVKSPTVQEMSVVQLSSAIADQRIELGHKVTSTYLQLQYIQWLIIIIGLVTTVVVSVSSTELFGKVDTPVGKTLRFMAIFLPAFGTAVAAVNAFYNPRDDWNKATNTLSSLVQLHGQISVGIWALECPKEDDQRKLLVAKLEEWTKRYNDVITLAESSPGAKQQQEPGQKPANASPPTGPTTPAATQTPPAAAPPAPAAVTTPN